MFDSLRQPQRATSPTVDTPRVIPSIRLTTATPVATATPLAPRQDSTTPRRVVPKKTLILHQAPPPLPLPPARVIPVPDHDKNSRPPSRSTGRFGSTNKIKVFVDPPRSSEDTPQLVKKKKSRAALDSIKWALGDRTNGAKDSSNKDTKERDPRPSIDSEKEREKWKWTLGRGRKDSKEKEKPGRRSPVPGSQPSSVRLQSAPQGSISSAYTLNTVSTSYLSPTSALAVPGNEGQDSSQLKTGSIAVRAMRSVRSMARIGTWGRSESPTGTQPSAIRRVGKNKTSSILTGSSGESWVAGAPSPTVSPFKDISRSSQTPRQHPDHQSSLPDERPHPTIKFASSQNPRRGSTLSTSTVSSGGESVLPRDSLSTGAPSVGSARSSFASSRRSSGATMSSFGVPSAFGHGTTTSRTIKAASRRDSKAAERGRKRGALSNVFELPLSSASEAESPKVQSRDSGSNESYGEQISVGSTFAMVEPHADPFAASQSDSFFPTMPGPPEDLPTSDLGIYVPGETPARRARPRPLSEQLLRPRPTGIVGDVPTDGDTVALNIVSAATDELSDLINRLDLSATPEASPAKRWTPNSSYYSPDPMPAFAMHTVERAIRQRYPDVPSSVGSKLDTSLNMDTSFASISTGSTISKPNVFGGPFTGSIADLRATATLSGRTIKIKPESSLTSLRPYSALATRRAGGAIRESVASTISTDFSSSMTSKASFASIDSPLKNRTVRGKQRRTEPREQSSAESLHAQLRTMTTPETRRNLGFSGTMGEQLEDTPGSDLYSPGFTESTADDQDSDIPDELQAIISSQSEDGGESLRSLEDTLSFSRPPDSPISTNLSVPSVEQRIAVTLTPPSIMVSDSGAEGDDDSPSDDDGEHEDDTGKKSFDFTGELNRLNKGGARLSFVEQLEVAFKTPDVILSDASSSSGSDSDGKQSPVALNWALEQLDQVQQKASAGHLNRDFKFGTPTATPELGPQPVKSRHSRSNTETSHLSEHELSLMSELDASMYALATLNLSLVHPSSQNTLTARPVDASRLSPEPVAPENVSLSNDIDSSTYKIANIDLSLIHPSGSHSREPSTDSNGSSTAQIPEPSAVMQARQPHLSLESDTDSKRHARVSLVQSVERSGHSREASEMSMSSLGSILNSGVSDPFGYKIGSDGNRTAPSPSHAHSDSLASIPSISSFGQVINPGRPNPFGYAPSSKEHSRNMSVVSDFSVSGYMDSSAASERRRKSRKSTDSDRSTFYFRSKPPPLPLPLPPALRGHQRDDSVMSTFSLAPPVSLHNNSYRRHQKTRLSSESGSSIAQAYGAFGASGGRAAWAQHKSEASVDSVMSDFSGARLGRPGLGDKMLESAADYRGVPLTSILASPSGSEVESFQGHARQSSMDSAQRSSDSDSLFDHPHKASSVSSDSVFGDDAKPNSQALLFGKNVGNHRIRPLSVFSVASASSSAIGREDDTLISMLGGGHVSRKAIGDTFAASPCFKPKRKRAIQVKRDDDSSEDGFRPTHKARLGEKSRSLASQASHKFGTNRMELAGQGLLERQSLEASVLSSEGADKSVTGASSVFSRPLAASTQRNIFAPSPPTGLPKPQPTPLVFTSAPPDTPPATDCSDAGSQSSIDFTRLSVVMENSRPSSVSSSRIRARGHGHRRRAASASRTSIVGAIAEVPELGSSYSSGSSMSSVVSSVPSADFDFVQPHVEVVEWEEDVGNEVMQRYLTLRKEALNIIQQSKQEFADTDFSRFAVASFKPPQEPAALQAFYDHSVRTYTPLPLELCIRRSRTNSRPTPYGTRTPKKQFAPRMPRPHARTESMEQAFSCISPPALAIIPPSSPFVIDRSFSTFGMAAPIEPAPPVPRVPTVLDSPHAPENFKPVPRQRVTSKVRRSALGWSKQRAPDHAKPVSSSLAPIQSATANGKENGEALGMLMSPTGSLRLSRPRPKSRPQSMLASVRS